eukprot:TRINITY_DN25110_c0_g1_i1.p1 TRINITY_DN25110_c0_g1~~TRINITY_DN25110_c0_g1_i1.p1  ORF type:complete len:123 (+),score=22.22 TRINITY_DN25110_c0_g1_i1:1-369(+)
MQPTLEPNGSVPAFLATVADDVHFPPDYKIKMMKALRVTVPGCPPSPVDLTPPTSIRWPPHWKVGRYTECKTKKSVAKSTPLMESLALFKERGGQLGPYHMYASHIEVPLAVSKKQSSVEFL